LCTEEAANPEVQNFAITWFSTSRHARIIPQALQAGREPEGELGARLMAGLSWMTQHFEKSGREKFAADLYKA